MFLGKKQNGVPKPDSSDPAIESTDSTEHKNARGRGRKSRRKRRRGAVRRAQDFLWYESLLESGVCVLGGGLYSVSLRLSDISYQLATPETKRRLLEAYARFFNQYGAGEQLTITIASRRVSRDELVGRVMFTEPRFEDDLALYRRDHNRMIVDMIGGRDYALVNEKYLTLTVSAPDLETAKATLERLAASVCSDMLTMLQCRAEVLDGPKRIEFLREWTRGCYKKGFDYAAMAASGASTHDEVAPQAVELSDLSKLVLTGDGEELHYQVLMVRDYATWLSDDLLAKLSAVQTDLLISLAVHPIDRSESHDLVMKRKAALDMERQSARRRLIKAQMDPEVDLPMRLTKATEEVKDLLDAMDREDQRLFTTTLVVAVRASSKEELAERVDQVRKVVSGRSCELTGLKYWQEAGFNTVLPLGPSRLPFHRTLTTAATAALMPFSSEEILNEQGLFYGLNATTRNPIILDRLTKRNGNAFILGTSGSGKSHLAKGEISQVLIGRPHDEVIIIDPEREYRPLGEAFGATIVEVHAGSQQTINPFDLTLSNLEGDPVKLKSAAVLGMLQVLLGGSEGLTGPERSVLDRCISNLYGRWTQNPGTPAPTFVDLLTELQVQPDEAAVGIAGTLELYATGSFSGFARQTNVDVNHRFVVYDTSQLGHSLQNFGLMVVLDAVWQRVVRNYGRGVRTWLYIDEFASMFSNRHAMEQLMAFYTRFRKYGGVPTGVLQNITALLQVEEGRRMLNNAEVLVLMGQSENDAEALEELLGLSDQQVRTIAAAQPGCGLIRVGPTILAFDARKPQDGPLAALFDTTFTEETRAGHG